MKFKVVIEPNGSGGYTTYVPSLPGCASEGGSIAEALTNTRLAIDLYFSEVDDNILIGHEAQVEAIFI